ncbi:hypothetical protein [Cellulomonas iranensis]|uniref:hypothetical protein n=1 Tax=Cellulomonas iranensis TaxID=76862 RepID=UPI0013D3DB95|nr:hypothetical protein [Cellulomonas iranensis]
MTDDERTGAAGGGADDAATPAAPARARRERKQVLLRLDPAVHDAVARWAADDLRSVNAQIDLLLRRALTDAGRMPHAASDPPRRGRPPRTP